MNKRTAMSALGYAIVLVIILGVVMIISAPMLANKYKDGTAEHSETYAPNQDDIRIEMRDMEERLNSRINELTGAQSNPTDISNKYVCVIDRNLTENSEYSGTGKFVFVCEYRR